MWLYTILTETVSPANSDKQSEGRDDKKSDGRKFYPHTETKKGNKEYLSNYNQLLILK